MCSNWEHNIFGMYIDVAVIDCYYWKCENVFFFLNTGSVKILYL
jgi:hypothetical protein